eukprot:3719974-Pyramimonas_sp.AAC.1
MSCAELSDILSISYRLDSYKGLGRANSGTPARAEDALLPARAEDALLPGVPGVRQAAGNMAVAMSVGVMNLAGCGFGALPVCHGAGGLAAQHVFGARSGTAVVVLGVGKATLGEARALHQ